LRTSRTDCVQETGPARSAVRACLQQKAHSGGMHWWRAVFPTQARWCRNSRDRTTGPGPSPRHPVLVTVCPTHIVNANGVSLLRLPGDLIRRSIRQPDADAREMTTREHQGPHRPSLVRPCSDLTTTAIDRPFSGRPVTVRHRVHIYLMPCPMVSQLGGCRPAFSWPLGTLEQKAERRSWNGCGCAVMRRISKPWLATRIQRMSSNHASPKKAPLLSF
jgi:hypothetical protein